MFQSTEEYELECNQTYKIITHHEYKGRFKGDFYFRDTNELYLEFDYAYNITTQTYCEHLFFLSTRKFYKFVSQKARIQTDMEHRAVNLIVSRILGEPYFKW